MSYIDNLVDWGDMLFRQYTRETINEARMLYVLAYDLLGKKPELLGTNKLSAAKTYEELRKERDAYIQTLLDMENQSANATTPLEAISGYILPNGSLLDPYGYFSVPENREFAGYWDTVEDRLYKIRYSLNIDGVKQLLPLFEPPIDVMALVRAVGSGMGLQQALADFNVAVPHYRFTFILAKARELTSRLTQFGQSLLSALEKKDAEELALLRNTHEKAILKLTLDIKKAQLEDARETVNALRANLKSAKTRQQHYNNLIANGLSPYEQTQLGMLLGAQIFTNMSQVFSVSSSMAGIIPEIGAFAFHFGGHNLAALFNGISQSYSAMSSNLSFRGESCFHPGRLPPKRTGLGSAAETCRVRHRKHRTADRRRGDQSQGCAARYPDRGDEHQEPRVRGHLHEEQVHEPSALPVDGGQARRPVLPDIPDGARHGEMGAEVVPVRTRI